MRFLVSAVAVVATLTFSTAASAQVSGYLGAGYSRMDRSVGPVGGLEGDFYALEGAMTSEIMTLGVTSDGAVVYSDSMGFKETALMITSHLNKRFDGVLVGAFFGADKSDDLSLWGAGLETMVDVGENALISGQIGYGQTHDLGFGKTDLWAGRADLRLYPVDALKLQFGMSYGEAKLAPGVKVDSTLIGFEAEYLIPRTRLSLRAGYDKYQIDDLMFEADIVRVGARYNFGAGSLRERDRNGAGLGTVNRLFALDHFAR